MQPKIGLTIRLLVVLIGVFVALFLRSTDLVIDPTLWLKDGVISFKDAYMNGIAFIFHSYAGECDDSQS